MRNGKRWLRAQMFRMQGHYATLKALFDEPPGHLKWRKVKALLAECQVKSTPARGRGEVIQLADVKGRIYLNYAPNQDVRITCLRGICDFLSNAGVDKPDAIWDFLERRGT